LKKRQLGNGWAREEAETNFFPGRFYKATDHDGRQGVVFCRKKDPRRVARHVNEDCVHPAIFKTPNLVSFFDMCELASSATPNAKRTPKNDALVKSLPALARICRQGRPARNVPARAAPGVTAFVQTQATKRTSRN